MLHGEPISRPSVSLHCLCCVSSRPPFTLASGGVDTTEEIQIKKILRTINIRNVDNWAPCPRLPHWLLVKCRFCITNEVFELPKSNFHWPLRKWTVVFSAVLTCVIALACQLKSKRKLYKCLFWKYNGSFYFEAWTYFPFLSFCWDIDALMDWKLNYCVKLALRCRRRHD